jgi:hypothetical protein
MRNIFFLYFQWHFYDRPRGIIRGWANCLDFNLNYWSVPVLIKTFFSPWRRYCYSYGKGFDFKRYAEVFTSNAISRVLGSIMRSFLIVIGLVTEIIVFFIGMAIFLGWLILPAVSILAIAYGVKLIF